METRASVAQIRLFVAVLIVETENAILIAYAAVMICE